MATLRYFIDALIYPIRVILMSPWRLFAAGRRLTGISLAARAAILVAVFLVIAVITAFVAFRWTQDRVALEYWFNPVRITVIVVLVILIPIVVYNVLKLWLEGDQSRFPDIDRAWRAGLAELQRQGLDPNEIPLFLLLGTGNEPEEKALFQASGLDLPVAGVPEGPAALHWYANTNGIYIVCSDVGCLSLLAGASMRAGRARGAGMARQPSKARSGGDGLRGTIISQPEMDDEAEASPHGDSNQLHGDVIRGTMVVGGGSGPAPAPPSDSRQAIVLSPEDRTEQERRLDYLCGLIQRTRQPYCPINGMLTLLPWELLQRPRESLELRGCVHRDLKIVRRTMMLRCPVTALVSGMQSDSGFCEMVRRVGVQRASVQRFGKGFSLWNPPTPDRMAALAAHACGAFEDCVYALFRERGALGKPGNTKLYALLCRVRRDVRDRLANVLGGGYGTEEDNHEDAMLFSGCYFAGTGETEDRQAFVRSVFDKLPNEQEELEWTETALDTDIRNQTWANLGFAFNALLVLVIVGTIVYRWFPFWK